MASKLGTIEHPVEFILRGQEGLKLARRGNCSQYSMFLLEKINKNKISFEMPLSALSKLLNTTLHQRKTQGTEAAQFKRQGGLLPSLSCCADFFCFLKRTASCWEAKRIKLLHKCKEAFKKKKRDQTLLGFGPD